MANAYVQRRLSLMPIQRHVWSAMIHAQHVKSLENVIHVQMVLLLVRISVLHVNQMNTSVETHVKAVALDVNDVTAAQTSVLNARLIQTWQQMELVFAKMEHSLMVWPLLVQPAMNLAKLASRSTSVRHALLVSLLATRSVFSVPTTSISAEIHA